MRLTTMSKDDETVGNSPVNAHRVLLTDPDVKAWYEEIMLANEVRADDYLRRFHRFCAAAVVKPARLVAKAKDPDGGRRFVERKYHEFAAVMLRPHKPADHALPEDRQGVKPEKCAHGHPPSYVGNYGKTLRSYMAYHDIVLRRIVVGDTDAAPTLEGVPLLTKEHVRTVLTAAESRGKVIIAFRAWTGVRPEVLGKPKGTDGLVLRDLPELHVRGKTVTFDAIPTQVIVRYKLSKIHKQELKFLPEEGCRYLKEYLEWRANNGEDLGPDSAVVRSDRYSTRRFLETQRISGIVRQALRAAGLPNRPYDLRNFFIDGLESAEHEGKIGHNNKEFFIGRKKEIDLRYTRFRPLRADVVEQLRAEYRACEPYLGAASEGMPPQADMIEALRAEVQEAVAKIQSGDPSVRAELEAFRRDIEELRQLRDELRPLAEEIGRGLGDRIGRAMARPQDP